MSLFFSTVSLNSSGVIYIDQGAANALLRGKSLLAAGITKIKGYFEKGENVLIVDQNKRQLARGLTSFNSQEIDKIKRVSKLINDISKKSEIINKNIPALNA